MDKPDGNPRRGRLFRLAVSILLPLTLAACVVPMSIDNESDAELEQRVGRSIMTAAAGAERQTDYQTAAVYYGKLYERQPENVDVLVGLSRSLRNLRRAKDAQGIIIKAMVKIKNDPRLLAELGKSQLALNDPMQAIETLSRSDSLDRNNWETVLALAVGFDRVEMYDQSDRYYARADKLSPENVNVLNNRALSLAQRNRLGQALEMMERAASLPEATAKVRQNLALLYAMAGKLEAAERLVREDLSADQADENMAFYRRLKRLGVKTGRTSPGAERGDDAVSAGAPAAGGGDKPELLPVEASYVVLRNAAVRAEPIAGSRRIGELTSGSKVHVSARTSDGAWLLVEPTSEVVGFVYAEQLTPLLTGPRMPPVEEVAPIKPVTVAPLAPSDKDPSNAVTATAPAAAERSAESGEAPEKTAASGQHEEPVKAAAKSGQADVAAPVDKPMPPAAPAPTSPAAPDKPAEATDPPVRTAALVPPPLPRSKPARRAPGGAPAKITPATRKAVPAASNEDGRPVGSSFRDCPDCPELVVLPAGVFKMGSPDDEAHRRSREGPRHEVSILRVLAVGKFEVTFAEWDLCVVDGGCNYRPDDHKWGRERRPVINVSWFDAQEYINWLNRLSGRKYRLLSEAEWEYTARAGAATAYHFGGAIQPTQAHFSAVGRSGGYRDRSVPVGSYPPNLFGLYDTHGNVREWTADCRHDNYEGAPGDGRAWLKTGDCDLRVIRGGSWGDRAAFLRAATRNWTKATNRSYVVGFRIARELDMNE